MVVFDNDIFSNHYLIHEIFKYFFCIIVALILIFKEKIGQKICLTEKNEKKDENEENSLKPSLTFISHITLIYRETFEKYKTNYPKMIIFSTFFLLIFLEQMIIIFRKFFVHMDFWMIDLFIVAFLNKKIFKIQIYRHQNLAFIFIIISMILNFVTVILTTLENNKEKALYVKYYYFIFVAFFIYCYFAFFYPFLL